MKKDLHHILQSGHGITAVGAIQHIAPAVQTTAVTPASPADLKGYHSCEVIIDAGAWTDGTWTLVLTEADTSTGSFSSVAAADIGGLTNSITINSTATANQLYLRPYYGDKRYVRLAVTQTSASSGVVLGATVLRGHRQNRGKLNETA